MEAARGGFPKLPPETPEPEISLPEVNISGRVIGDADNRIYQITLENLQGERISQWKSDATGHFSAIIGVDGPFVLVASPVNQTLTRSSFSLLPGAYASPDVSRSDLVSQCDGDNYVVCNITPWSTLIHYYAAEKNLSFEEARLAINKNPWLSIDDEDPFIVWKNDPAHAGDLDIPGILEKLQRGELLEWLTDMEEWVTDSEEIAAPVGLPIITVTTLIAEGGSASPKSATVRRSDKTAFTLSPDVGYRIIAATGCPGTLSGTVFTTTPLNDPCELNALFSKTLYQIIYSAGAGGTLSGNLSQSIAHGFDSSPVTAIPATGYIFSAWSDGKTDNPRYDAGVTGDLALGAIFTPASYDLHYSAGTGGRIEGDLHQSVIFGDPGSAVTAVALPGYFFVRWSDGSIDNPRTDIAVSGNLSVQAIFENSAVYVGLHSEHWRYAFGRSKPDGSAR